MTFFDWAVKATICAEQEATKGAVGAIPNVHIHMLEVVRREEWPRAFGMQIKEALRPFLPWLTVYSLCRTDIAAFGRVLMSADTTSVETLRSTSQSGMLTQCAVVLRQLWVSDITKAETRHSIANALGPMLIASDLGQSGNESAAKIADDWLSGRRRYFAEFLSNLGIPASPHDRTHDATSLGGPTPVVDLRKPKSRPTRLGKLGSQEFFTKDYWGRYKRLRFALVDDQAMHGFHDVLAAFIFDGDDTASEQKCSELTGAPPSRLTASADNHLTLASFDSPYILLDWLRHLDAEVGQNWNVPRIFGKASETEPYSDSGLVPFDILFLDLRLFGIERETVTEDEKRFYGDLLKMYAERKDLIADKRSGLSASQRMAIQRAADSASKLASGGTHRADATHYALLPLLIAAYDPTAPVIIFSSSQQRAVLDLFAPFPNIITSFSKPALTGYADDDLASANRVVDRLIAATRQALLLHEKRLLWELIRGFNLKSAVPPPCLINQQRFLQPSDRKPTTINSEYFNFGGYGRLPFTINRWFETRFLSTISKVILSEIADLDSLYRPYEFLESCLAVSYRQTVAGKAERGEATYVESDSLAFEFSNRVFLGQTAVPTSYKLAQKLKKIRHAAVHGLLSDVSLDENAIRHCAMIAILMLLGSIGNQEILDRLASLGSEAHLAKALSGNAGFLRDEKSNSGVGIREILTKSWR
jgi:hypothetical protein